MPLSWNEIRIRAARFANDWKDATNEQADKQTFWNEFFEIFGVSRRSTAQYEFAVKRLGRASGFIDLFWPGTLVVEHKSRGESLEKAYNQAMDYGVYIPDQDKPRYIITSDFKYIRLYDLETIGKQSEWEINLKDLPTKVDLFGFIAGYNKQEVFEENPVNRKAAERLAELHDQLKSTGYTGHDLEVLLVRLLFCLFAEDSQIFEKHLFHDFIYSRTNIDGSDLGAQLNSLFEALNMPREKRQTNLDEIVNKFPYVNGKLFNERIAPASFDHKMRDQILNTAHQLNWSQISPAIFGSMFQGVMDPKARRSFGAHYTSEQNILKVIQPLFLDELHEEFNKVKDDRRLLEQFHKKLASLKFMDPACGCGNFLVVSYREIRKLELEILKISHTIPGMRTQDIELDIEKVTLCNVDQFYGIEVEEFPAQIAQVAMWLTDSQMNNAASDYFGKPLVRLPLTHSATIVKDDALELGWSDLIPASELNYLFGNPPFSGGKLMSQSQRDQVVELFPKGSGAGVLDFVAGWYAKAIKYIQGTDVKVAFVSTNSISQGEQVSIIWKHLLACGAKINFAHRTFRWANEGKGRAAVYCVIIGFWLKDSSNKQIYDYITVNGEPHVIEAKNINPYLIDGPDILVSKRSEPISNVPKMDFGNMPNDGGNFLLTDVEKNEIVKRIPQVEQFIRPLISAKEFLNGEKRWCIWLEGVDPGLVRKIPELMTRIENVKKLRLESSRKTTQELAKHPSLFGEIRQPETNYLLIPRVSSENRIYIPMGLIDKGSIVSDTCFSIPGGELYHFGVLESGMHMTWMRYVAGRLESRYRYSKDIVYNNFPWPEANQNQQKAISDLAQAVLDARANHPESSLADLYDPLTMPADLLKAHQALDSAIDKLYSAEKFDSDAARMQLLLELYKSKAALIPIKN